MGIRERRRQVLLDEIADLYAHEGLSPRHARLQLAIDLASRCRECNTRRQVRRRVASLLQEQQEVGSVRFDPLLVLAFIEVVIAIWKLLRESGILQDATPQSISQFLASEGIE